MEVRELTDSPDLVRKVLQPDYKAKPERIILLHLEAFDWNCPQHITPRFSEAELQTSLGPVRMRLEELEAENKRLRQAVAAKNQ
jgi:hypothetical protein